MQKKIAFFAVTLATMFLSMIARADGKPLLGIWQLKSFVREASATGERYNQLGDHPYGYIYYSPEGRMQVFFVSGDQPRPSYEPTDEERIKLHNSMFAYGGTYSMSPGKVAHHIDIEWNGRHLGTGQVRIFTVEGDKLLIKTEPNKSLADGREGVGILAFERANGSLLQ